MPHTPLPWRLENIGAGTTAWGVVSESGRVVVEHDFINEANAAFIVTACNAHADLLEAAKAVLANPGCHDGDCCDYARANVAAIGRLRDAIAKADGGQ